MFSIFRALIIYIYIYICSKGKQMHFGFMNLILSFYIHGSVHRESKLITVQKYATLFSLLHFCRQLYMFWTVIKFNSII